MNIPKELRGFFDKDGKLKQWPSKQKKKLLAIKFLAEKFETSKEYSAEEITKILLDHHTFNDVATIRRDMISQKVLDRTSDGRTYWKVEEKVKE